MPVVPASDWVKAQKLSEDGVFKCTFKMKGSYIVPSSHLLRHLPKECKTPEEKKAYIQVSRLPRPNPNPNCPRRHLTNTRKVGTSCKKHRSVYSMSTLSDDESFSFPRLALTARQMWAQHPPQRSGESESIASHAPFFIAPARSDSPRSGSHSCKSASAAQSTTPAPSTVLRTAATAASASDRVISRGRVRIASDADERRV